MVASQPIDNLLYAWLLDLQDAYRSGEFVPGNMVESPFGVHGTMENEEDGEVFLQVGFILPDDIYAEIEDGTYGELQCFRIYKQEI